MADTWTAAEVTAWHDNRRARDRHVHEVARALVRERPLRVRVAARIAATVYACAGALPGPLARRIFRGWDTALDRPLGATVCRLLGHAWYLVVPGAPRRGLGHLVMCESCHTLISTDDPDAFHPGSRERRDFAAFAFELDVAADDARYLHPWPPPLVDLPWRDDALDRKPDPGEAS